MIRQYWSVSHYFFSGYFILDNDIDPLAAVKQKPTLRREKSLSSINSGADRAQEDRDLDTRSEAKWKIIEYFIDILTSEHFQDNPVVLSSQSNNQEEALEGSSQPAE